MRKIGKHRQRLYEEKVREDRVNKRNSQRTKWAVFLLLLAAAILRFRNRLIEGFHEIAGIPAPDKLGILMAATGYMLVEGKIIERLSKIFHADIKWKTGIGCAYYCSFARMATFGGGAGAAEIYYLSREGMELAHALDISLIQYLCQKVAVTCAGVVSLLFLFPEIEASIDKYGKYLVGGISLAAAVTAAILLVMLSQRVAGLLFRFLDWVGKKKEDGKSRTEAWKEQILSGRAGIRTMLQQKGRLAEIFAWNIVKYFCWYSIPYILYKDTGVISLFTSIGRMAIATVMASVIPAPGGYGSLEFMQLLLFGPVLGESRAISMMLLYRAAATFIPAIIGGVVVFLYERKNDGGRH